MPGYRSCRFGCLGRANATLRMRGKLAEQDSWVFAKRPSVQPVRLWVCIKVRSVLAGHISYTCATGVQESSRCGNYGYCLSRTSDRRLVHAAFENIHITLLF